ncbi:MAG: glycosyltransferase [Pseudomonadota bacterium]
MRVAYLINQYPKVSHSFIRREIQALERGGTKVLRIAVRGWEDTLADPADLAERSVTRYLLRSGWMSPICAALRNAFARPVRFAGAFQLMWSMWRRSDRTLPHHLAYLIEAAYLVELLDREQIKHLHAHFGTNPADVATLAFALGGPRYSFTVHGPEEFDHPVALGLRQKVQNAAFVVAISSFGRSQLYRWLVHEDWHKVQVVHCGLEREFYEAAPTHAAPARRLVCVGRLCEQKGQLLLVAALHRVMSRSPEYELELVLAGDGELREEIEALIGRFGMQGQVRITGWVGSSEVRNEILAARALVLPSFAEGLPVVLMEAMVLRRPVITTFIAGIPELVRDGENGWLVPAGDIEALAAAIEACLGASAEVIARMGDAARQRAMERHDIDQEVSKLATLFAASAGAPCALLTPEGVAP